MNEAIKFEMSAKYKAKTPSFRKNEMDNCNIKQKNADQRFHWPNDLRI